MTRKLICVTAALVLPAALGVWAGEMEIDWTYSGSYVTSAVDVNLDGAYAKEFELETKGAPGKAVVHGAFEVIILGAVDECPPPQVGMRLLYNTYVARFSNGDLLYGHAPEQPGGCIDRLTGTASGTQQIFITGGTGKFEGATGSYVDTYSIRFLLLTDDPMNSIGFASVVGHSEGSIQTSDD